ncbi:HisA/HisF-related TIM barrel protein [Amylibacter sp.]|nr:HisA/HisF-related TIM barrel protein [Amylibacter sp.]
MIKKRIAAAVVVKNNRVVQSFSFFKYLPLGSVNVVVQNLDRWSVDDIIVLNIDRTAFGLGPNIEVINKISSIPISTPLTYGGGISSVNEALAVINAGAERIILDNVFINKPHLIKKISEAIGSQAIILSIPFRIIDGSFYHFDYVTKKSLKIDFKKIKQFENLVSELLLIDVESEGYTGSYNYQIIKNFSDLSFGLICYGGVGLGPLGSKLLNEDAVNSIVYGNILSYGELFFQKVKKSLNKSKHNIRRSIFRDKI